MEYIDVINLREMGARAAKAVGAASVVLFASAALAGPVKVDFSGTFVTDGSAVSGYFVFDPLLAGVQMVPDVLITTHDGFFQNAADPLATFAVQGGTFDLGFQFRNGPSVDANAVVASNNLRPHFGGVADDLTGHHFVGVIFIGGFQSMGGAAFVRETQCQNAACSFGTDPVAVRDSDFTGGVRYSVTAAPSGVPAPGALVLMGAALAGLGAAGAGRARRKALQATR